MWLRERSTFRAPEKAKRKQYAVFQEPPANAFGPEPYLLFFVFFPAPLLPFRRTYLTAPFCSARGERGRFSKPRLPNNANGSALRMLHRALPLNGS